MNARNAKFSIRIATSDDTDEMCALLNQIIDIGGTTALETRLTQDQFENYFLQGESYICCHVAIDAQGLIAGFQSLTRHAKLPDNWADIATFARVNPKTPGVGTALFARSCLYAKNSGFVAINATIRADNKGGLQRTPTTKDGPKVLEKTFCSKSHPSKGGAKPPYRVRPCA